MKDGKKFGVFDIDGSTITGSLLILLVDCLLKKSIFPKEAYEGYMREYMAYRDHEGTYDKYIMAVVKVFSRHIAGKSVKDVTKAAVEVVEGNEWRTYLFTTRLIQLMRNYGYELGFLSHSPDLIVELFGKKMAMNFAVGTEYLVKDGLFTGERKGGGLIAYNKLEMLNHILHDRGCCLADLDHLVYLDDTSAGIPVLKVADVSFCMRPDMKLLEEHLKHLNWIKIDEQKGIVFANGELVRNPTSYLKNILIAP